jgi:hypothetical protein
VLTTDTPEPTPVSGEDAIAVIASAVPEATKEPTQEPRLTGQIHVTVYSDIYDETAALSGNYPSVILADETFDAATFTDYKLPPLPQRSGYTALGYVLLLSSCTEYLDSLLSGDAEPHIIGTVALNDDLIANDAKLSLQGSDGVYEVEIHVVWLDDELHLAHLEFYDETLFGDYYVGFGLTSDQLCYLAPFPTPEREGKTFIGWCDAEGHMIDAVTYYDFFEKLPDAQAIEDRDFNQSVPCKVYACWSDGTGGVPEAMPTPTATPTIQPPSAKSTTPPPSTTPTTPPPSPTPWVCITPTPSPTPTPQPTPWPYGVYEPADIYENESELYDALIKTCEREKETRGFISYSYYLERTYWNEWVNIDIPEEYGNGWGKEYRTILDEKGNEIYQYRNLIYVFMVLFYY